MEKENINTVKYSASVNIKFSKVALQLGLSKRMLFEKMVDYFYRTKKDPADFNDGMLKNTLAKNHDTYTSFIKTQEKILLIPMEQNVQKMVSNQAQIVKFFNEQVLNANKSQLKNQLELSEKFFEVESLIKMIAEQMQTKKKMKVLFNSILNNYIRERENIGAFKTKEKEDLAIQTRKIIADL